MQKKVILFIIIELLNRLNNKVNVIIKKNSID